MAAPIILLVARLIQGFSCGGEVGPATTYLLESVPDRQARGRVTAWQGYSQQIAIFLGSLVGVILTTSLSSDQMHAWGWRVPFLLGVGHRARRAVHPPPVARDARASGRTVDPRRPRRHCCAITGDRSLIGILIICGGTVSTYMFNYMTTYAITTLHLSATIGTTLTLTGSRRRMAGIYSRRLRGSLRPQAHADRAARAVRADHLSRVPAA